MPENKKRTEKERKRKRKRKLSETFGLAATATSPPLRFQWRLYCPKEHESSRSRWPPYLVIVRPFVFQNTNEGSRGTLTRRDTDRRYFFPVQNTVV